MSTSKRKPIDYAYIEELMRPTALHELKRNSRTYDNLRGMHVFELSQLYQHTSELLDDLQPFDPARPKFLGDCFNLESYAEACYFGMSDTYRENHLAIKIPLPVDRKKHAELTEILNLYSSDTLFCYTHAHKAMVIRPTPYGRKLPKFFEFLDMLHEYELASGIKAVDASFYFPQ